MNEPTPLPADPETLAEELAEQYLDALQSGQNPDRAALLAAYPDLADLLNERLDLIDLMHRTATGDDTDFTTLPPHHLTTPPPYHPESIARYTILSVLGRGASGTVYHAYDPKYDREVALKLLHADRRLEPRQLERFQREARIVAQLRHPNIVPLHEAGEHDGRPYFDLMLVPGETLETRMARAPLTPREAAELVRQLADALDYAHRQGIVHRDVKPANILLANGGRKPPGTESNPGPDAAPGGSHPPLAEVTPHLTDFGLAHRSDEASLTGEGTLVGTVAYMSPEQAQGGTHAVDGRSDVYSLGVVLYRLLTGQLPYPLTGPLTAQLYQIVHTEPTPLCAVKPDLPRDLETICLKTLAKDPADRFPTAAAFAEELRRWLHDEPLTVRPPTWWEKARRWGRRNRVAARVAVAAGVLLGVVSGTLGAMALEQREQTRQEKANRYLAQAEATLKEQTAAILKWRSLLHQARTRMQQPTQGRRDDAQAILKKVVEVRSLVPDNETRHDLDIETRSIYAATLGMLEVVRTHEQRVPKRHLPWPVALHPGGQSMAIGAPNRPLFWERGKSFQAPPDLEKESRGPSPHLAYSPNGRFLAFAPASGGLQLWNETLTLEMPSWRPPQNSPVLAMAFSQDGKTLWACCANGRAQALNLPKMEEAQDHFHPEKKSFAAAAFSPDCAHLLLGDHDGRVLLCNLREKKVHEIAPDRAGMSVTALAWSPDGTRFAVGIRGGLIQLRSMSQGRLERGLSFPFPGVDNILLGTHPPWIMASWRYGGKTFVWDYTTGNVLITTEALTSGTTREFSRFASGNSDAVAFSDFNRAEAVRALSHPGPVESLYWCEDHQHLVTMDCMFMVYRWNAHTGHLVDSFRPDPGQFNAAQGAVAISADARYVVFASGGNDHSQAVIWDVQEKDKPRKYALPKGGGYERLAFADGKFVLVREEDVEPIQPQDDHPEARRVTQGVHYDWEIGKPPMKRGIIRPPEPKDYRRFLTHSLTPDGRFYLWIGPRHPDKDRRVEVLSLATQQRVGRVTLQTSTEAAFVDPSGQFLWLKGPNHTSLVHDLVSGAVQQRAVEGLAVSPNERWMISVHKERPTAVPDYIQLWNGKEPWLRFYLVDGFHPTATFSRDGRFLALYRNDHTMSIINIPALQEKVTEFETSVLPK